MTQTISRLYQARENADAAVTDLKTAGFEDREIAVVAPGQASDEQILDAVRGGGVAPAHASAYAEGIKRGETLVSVQAPFGDAAKAIAMLQRHGPVDTGPEEPGYEKAPPDPAAPLSSACGWTVLIDNPAPLSSLLNWRVLSDRRPPPRKLDSELIDNPAPLSKKIGAPVLTDSPAALSSRAGWRVLWDDPAPLSRLLRWRPLSKEQNPPPARFGFHLLWDNPAPLSGRIGWKLLSNDPAPLSRLLGWRVLSTEPPKRAAPQER